MKIRVRWQRAYFWPMVGVVFVVSGLLGLVFLRMNNENMTKLRSVLIVADRKQDIGEVQLAAKNLQRYVAHHMNTSTGKVALQSMYNRDAEAALSAVRPAEIDELAYQNATDACRTQLSNYGYRAWASCVADKVGTNPAATSAIEADVAPDPDLYYIDYASARWSNDPAGWCVLAFIISGVMLIVKLLFMVVRWFTKLIKSKLLTTRVLTPVKH